MWPQNPAHGSDFNSILHELCGKRLTLVLVFSGKLVHFGACVRRHNDNILRSMYGGKKGSLSLNYIWTVLIKYNNILDSERQVAYDGPSALSIAVRFGQYSDGISCILVKGLEKTRIWLGYLFIVVYFVLVLHSRIT